MPLTKMNHVLWAINPDTAVTCCCKHMRQFHIKHTALSISVKLQNKIQILLTTTLLTSRRMMWVVFSQSERRPSCSLSLPHLNAAAHKRRRPTCCLLVDLLGWALRRERRMTARRPVLSIFSVTTDLQYSMSWKRNTLKVTNLKLSNLSVTSHYKTE